MVQLTVVTEQATHHDLNQGWHIVLTTTSFNKDLISKLSHHIRRQTVIWTKDGTVY